MSPLGRLGFDPNTNDVYAFFGSFPGSFSAADYQTLSPEDRTRVEETVASLIVLRNLRRNITEEDFRPWREERARTKAARERTQSIRHAAFDVATAAITSLGMTLLVSKSLTEGAVNPVAAALSAGVVAAAAGRSLRTFLQKTAAGRTGVTATSDASDAELDAEMLAYYDKMPLEELDLTGAGYVEHSRPNPPCKIAYSREDFREGWDSLNRYLAVTLAELKEFQASKA